MAVGLVFNPHGQVLFAQRPAGKPYAGWWEFPGGKVERGESVEQALARELAEELGLTITSCRRWITREHVYPHASVRLHFCKVTQFTGEPQGLEGQAFVWADPSSPDVAPMLPAAVPMLPWLCLPTLLPLSAAAILGVPAWSNCLANTLSEWLVLREPDLADDQLDKVWSICREWRGTGARQLLVSSRHPVAWAQSVDGVLLTERDLLVAMERPAACKWVGASVHSRDGLLAAHRIGCDFALLGPVNATASHPGAPALGWETWAAMIQQTPLPVFALGGLNPSDAPCAIRHGAQGIALMRAAWTNY